MSPDLGSGPSIEVANSRAGRDLIVNLISVPGVPLPSAPFSGETASRRTLDAPLPESVVELFQDVRGDTQKSPAELRNEVEDLLTSVSRAREDMNFEVLLERSVMLDQWFAVHGPPVAGELERVILKELARAELLRYEIAREAGEGYSLARFYLLVERALHVE